MCIYLEIAAETVAAMDNFKHDLNVALAMNPGDPTSDCLEYFQRVEAALTMARMSLEDRIRAGV